MCVPFTLAELKTVLRSLRRRKAAGPDEIANEFLKHLGPLGQEALLALCNASWARAEVPMAWRIANIIPLLKQGKDPQAAKSYRPVSLTSNVAKVMERLVRARLQYVTERWGLLNPQQAGYRRCRSAEEQLVLITQCLGDALVDGESLCPFRPRTGTCRTLASTPHTRGRTTFGPPLHTLGEGRPLGLHSTH